MRAENTLDLLYFPRWMEVLIAIARLPKHKRYPQKLYRAAPSCASHIKTVLKALEAHRLIRIDRTTRIRWIHMTFQGETLSQHLLQVRWRLASLFPQQALEDSGDA